jgi:hypothetical protein
VLDPAHRRAGLRGDVAHAHRVEPVLADDPQQRVDELGAALVRGFGSALAKGVWDANWGLPAVAERWTPMPVWLGVVVGVAGLVVIVLSRRPVGGRR